MNTKTLIGLAVAALAAIVAAIVLNRGNRPQSENGGEQVRYLVPALRDHVNDVSKIIITGADNKPLATLTRSDQGWSVAERSGYAADTGKLREFLLKLSDAKLLEQKTASKDKYSALGVEDVADKDAKGVEVELDGLGDPIKLIVGNTNPRAGTYVRRAGEAQSWLASGIIAVDKKPESWLRKDLADIPATRIAEVEITHPDGKTVRIAKDAEGDANFKLQDVPKGREPGSDFTIDSIASTLGGLRFDDVLATKEALPADNALKAHYVTFDGLMVDVVAWEKDGKDYAQLTASANIDRATRHITAQQAKAKADHDAEVAAQAKGKPAAQKGSAGESAAPPTPAAAPTKPAAIADPDKDREQKLAALDKEVTDLNARFKDWTYLIPAYKFANINKSMDDLLKAPPEKTDGKKAEESKKRSPKKKSG
jgi:Domain of unknown function (DUF4340)